MAFECVLGEDRSDDPRRGVTLRCWAFDADSNREGPPDEAVRAWGDGLAVNAPLALARYGDLLWTFRRDAGAARTAIGAYLEVSTDAAANSMISALATCRAVQLAMEINDKPRLEQASERAIRQANASLDGTEHEPGIPLRLVASLTRLPDPAQPSSIDEILTRLEQRYDTEPPVLDAVTDLIARRSDEAGAAEARKRQIDRWIRWGDAQGGFHRLFALRKGLEVAQVAGLRPEINSIREQLQSVRHSDLDLKELSYEVDVDRGRVDRALDLIVGDDSFSEFPSRLAINFGPPAGLVDENRRLIRELMQEFPLSFLFPKTMLGPEDTRLRHVAGDDQHAAVEIIEQEARSIGWFAHLAAEALDRAFTKYGLPDTTSLAEFFESEFVDSAAARRFARAVELHSQGDFDSTAHVIAPRLERVIRALARASGVLVVREPSGDRPGGVRGLNELLPDLAGHLDESWRRYLFNLLAEPLGVNLRNRLGHGLVDEARRDESAILIHAASWLSLLESSTGSSDAGAGRQD